MRSRGVIQMFTEVDDTMITVEHVYLPEGASGECSEEHCCNLAHDPGAVGLILTEDEATVSALLTAGEALMLANRLQRAASLVLESEEQVPDIEREAARFAVTDKPGAS
jgi:hypothetical protein